MLQDSSLKNNAWDLPREMTHLTEIKFLDVIPFLCLATIALGIEGWTIQHWLNGEMDASTVAWVHLGVIVALILWSYLSHHTGQVRELAYLLTLFTIILGPLGAGGTLVTTGLYFWFKQSATPFSEWYEALFPDIEHLQIKKIYDKAVDEKNFHSNKNPIIPFIDVLHYGTIQQKQSMIVLLIKNHHGKFANVLRMALEDSDGSVRVLAAKGMSKIEQHFLTLKIKLEKRLEDEQISESEFLKNQILIDDEYLYSGILDDIRSTEVRKHSLENCEQYLRLHPDDLDISFILGRIFLRNGQNEKAANWFEECIHKGFQSPKIYAWYFECLYQTGQFNKLRKTAEFHFNEIQEFKQVFQPDVYEVIKGWAGQKTDVQQKSIADNNNEHSVTETVTSSKKMEQI